MNRLKSYTRIAIIALYAVTLAQSQTTTSTTVKQSAVPSFVRFSGAAKDITGKPLNGVVGVTFSLYADEQSNAPLWSEIQNVQVDATGGYKVSLGASKPLPLDLFASGEARWLGVQISGGAPEKRTLLLSVPYALKAGDAETIGGLPPSAFVLATPANNSQVAAGIPSASSTSASAPLLAPSAPAPASSNVTTTGGTVNTLPLFSTATNIQNSLLSQTGTTAINVGGKLNLPATGAATTTAGTKSRPQAFVASAFNSGTAAAVNQTFQWQAEPAGNNTATPTGTMNLLFGSGTAFPAETGLKISNKGVFTFAAGQTFPGTGTLTGITTANTSGLTGGGATGNLTLSLLKTCANNQVLQWNGTAWVCATSGTGTLTGITTAATSGLTGGGTTGTLTMSLLNTCATNQVLQWNGMAWVCATSNIGTITGLTAGTDLTGGGITGNVTMNLDTTKVPQLSANNSFTMNNSFAGTVGVGTTVPAAQLDVEAPASAITGIQGVTSSAAFFAAGIFGHATGASGTTRGVYGVSDSPLGIGVHGIGAIGGQFESGNGTIFVGRGQGATRVTIDSLGNTATSGGISAGGVITATGGVLANNVVSASVVGGTTAMVGIADQGPGGFFQTSGPTEGIEAESLNTGFGVRGFALGNSGQGVWGESSGTTIAANGFGPDGVDGITHSANGSGVAGVNYAAGGTAVYGGAPNGGIGFQTPNNVQQGRGAGGWVKAMVFVDPFTASGTAITRCYNSQASGATVNTPPCGFSVVHEGLGIDLIDFGFQVNDRFISATQFSANSITACVMDPNNACFLGQISPNANQVLTLTVFYTGNTTDSPFWIIVF